MTAAQATAAELDTPEASVVDEDSGAPVLDHAYDGIQEYDNPLPSWWSVVFAATVVFSFLYFAYYNIAGWGHSPDDRYKIALAGWQAGYKGTSISDGPTVSEDTLAAGAENAELVARGKDVFLARCTGCHANDASGNIGPNLTDLYQLHGTTRMDLFATITGGVPGTAMIAWSETLKSNDIVSVATYISSLRGKNLKGKEPQGKPVPALVK